MSQRGQLVEVAPAEIATDGKGVTRGPAYRHESAKDGFSTPNKRISNLFDSFIKSVEDFPYRDCLGWRPNDDEGYRFLTYKETLRWIERVAAGMNALKLSSGDRAGVYAHNCKELMFVM